MLWRNETEPEETPEIARCVGGYAGPDWGALKSFRTFEAQLETNLANLERHRRRLLTDIAADRSAAGENEWTPSLQAAR